MTTSSASLVLLVTACSPPQPRAEFQKQVTLADRIVVTNRYRPVTMTVTGSDFQDVSRAVINATEAKGYVIMATFDWDIQFYAGSNFITVIHLQDRSFLVGTNQYSDSSGVLKQFWQVLEHRAEGK